MHSATASAPTAIQHGLVATKDVVYAPETGILATPIAAGSSPETDPPRAS